MEELEALLRDLEGSGTPRDPPKGPQKPPGTPPGAEPGPEPEPEPEPELERLYSSVRRPRPPPRAPPPPARGELERLLRDLSAERSEPLLAPPPEDGPEIRGSPPPRGSGTPPGPPKFGEGAPKSAATRELERLMAALAEFHLQQPQAPPKPPPPGSGGDLESLLALLQAELRGRGNPTGARGLCGGCSEPLRGQSVRALGGSWHPECFTCASCGGPVLGAVVTALGRPWHPEHFCCSHCGEALGDQGFLERAGRPFCRRDFGALFGGRCRGCGDAVLEGGVVSALGGLWHPPCFVCQVCGRPFPEGSFYERGGAPVCRRHFREEGPAWGRS